MDIYGTWHHIHLFHAASLYIFMFATGQCAVTASKFAVAPMMRHTTQHFRHMFRYITQTGILYTEMIMADEIVTAKKLDCQNSDNIVDRLLALGREGENGTILQLGGRDPDTLARASEIALGNHLSQGSTTFRGINLNVGEGKVINILIF